MWFAAVILALGACAPEPASVPAAPADATMVMAGVWPFVLDQGTLGAPCALELKDSEGNRGIVSVDAGGKITAIAETTLAGVVVKEMDFEYDLQGRLVAFGSRKAGEWMRYAYDTEGRLAERRYTDGDCKFAQVFAYEGGKATILDDRGCDGSVDDASLKIVKDDRGRWHMEGEGSSDAVIVYDDQGRSLGIADKGQIAFLYERDETGRVTTITPLTSTWIHAPAATVVYDCSAPAE